MMYLTGDRFGFLVVLEEAPRKPYRVHGLRQWRCLCNCGREVIVRQSSLTSGRTVSCGCYRKVIEQVRSA